MATISTVLLAMHQVAAQAAPSRDAPPTDGPSFGAFVQQSIQRVSERQQHAEGLTQAFERGDDVDLAAVMVARQQASVEFQAVLQVRRQLLDAYRELNNMPL